MLTTPPLAASGLCLCAICLAGARDRGNKDLYYKALRRTQTTLKSETPDWEPWGGFFLRCLKKQKDTLAARLDHERTVRSGEADLPELSIRVLEALRAKERLTIAQLASMTDANGTR